jgi:tRNA-modifying protein YgfZ
MLFVRLPLLTVLDVTGKDSTKIANNLCTTNVETIGDWQGREAFITDVRGKTLGHVCLFRTDEGIRMIGSGRDDSRQIESQAPAIAAHFDKYTLREQAVPNDRSDQSYGIVVTRELLAKLDGSIATLATDEPSIDLPWVNFQFSVATNQTLTGSAYRVPWWNEAAVLLLLDVSQANAVAEYLESAGGIEADESEFHRRRIVNHFPWFGVDLDTTHLPQEADRDALAISFTKGCYLGQETVARLDALGQVQKKLVGWEITCEAIPAIGTELKDADRVVGRLTSIERGAGLNHFVALGFARRSHFTPGSTAFGVTTNGVTIQGVVSVLK